MLTLKIPLELRKEIYIHRQQKLQQHITVQ